MTTFAQNGYSFNYIEQGQGQPLVLVHGSASDLRTWWLQEDRFAHHFRTIAYSRRYHWPNEPIAGGADYAMAEHVEDLKVLVRSLDAGPAHVVAHSYGAFVALLLALREPRWVDKLVLAEPPAITLFTSNTPRPGELLRLLLTRPRTAVEIIKFGARGLAPAAAALQRDDREAALDAFGRATLGKDAYHSLSPARKDQARLNLIKAELLGSGFPPLDDEALRQMQVPTLLVSGQHSPRLFHRIMDRLEELLPNAARVEIPDASHIMHEDNPDAYHHAVLSFLRDQPGRA